MLTPADRRTLGALMLSCANAADAPLGTRPLGWFNTLARLGVTVPLPVAHDLGVALLGAAPSFAQRPDVTRLPGGPLSLAQKATVLGDYARMLGEVSATDLAVQARRANLDDAVITTLLARALGAVVDRWRGPRVHDTLLVAADAYTEALTQLPALFTASDRTLDWQFVQHLVAHRLHVLLALEQIDLDTLELLRMFGRDTGARVDTDLVDLLSIFSSPEANDVVNFSLDLLPSVLEAHRGGGQQLFAVDGYSGVVSTGSLDSLVLTEMAHDDALFEQRFLDHEILYYAHEAQVRPQTRTYQILVDGSASMRGARSVFARGLAIALAKRMSLLGCDAAVRFFDSRLYEPLRVRRSGRTNGPLHLAGVLAFRGEHGRNYARVFSQFAAELDRARDRGNITTYVITHAECHVPGELVRRVTESSELHMVFMMPSRGALDLDYLGALTSHEVVTEESLRDRSERATRALSIVETASADVRGASVRR